MDRKRRIELLEREHNRIVGDLQRLAGKADNLRGVLGQRVTQLRSALQEDARDATRAILSEAGHVASSAVSDTGESIRSGVRSGAERTAEALDPREIVKSQPLAGFLVMATVGMAVGLAVAKRRPVEQSQMSSPY
jgi:ElaB/YqjD/DUF883 family membrane-anchored ribosome-binding protein